MLISNAFVIHGLSRHRFMETLTEGNDCLYIRYIMVWNLLYQSFSVTEKAVSQSSDSISYMNVRQFRSPNILVIGRSETQLHFQTLMIRKKEGDHLCRNRINHTMYLRFLLYFSWSYDQYK